MLVLRLSDPTSEKRLAWEWQPAANVYPTVSLPGEMMPPKIENSPILCKDWEDFPGTENSARKVFYHLGNLSKFNTLRRSLLQQRTDEKKTVQDSVRLAHQSEGKMPEEMSVMRQL